jgi:anti-sigma factor RsiW
MNKRFSSDDPQLTAYALGELDAAEAAVVEARLRSDPAARAVVEEIRATARQLEAALAAEPAAPVAAERELVAARPEPKVIHLPYARRRRGWAQLLGFPQSYFLVSGAAAAAFIGFVMLQSPQFDPPDRVARQLAAEQRARAIAEARYDALRSQLEALEQSQVQGDAPAPEPKATFRGPPSSPRVVFVMPPSLPLPKPEPIIGDFRHLAVGWAGYAEAPARAMADSLSESGNEESGDDLIRMDPYLVSADEDYFALSYLAYPMTIANVLDWARSGIASAADDPGGFRREYFNIVRRNRGMLQ